MKKTKSNSRKALTASGISLVLCLAMLIGTTFAWFSDSVSNKGNKITAGNLKIGFYVSDVESTTLPAIGATNANAPTVGDWTDLKFSETPIFTIGTDAVPAQPGDKLTKYIAIRNEGSIPLKYVMEFIVEDSGLGDAATFAFKELSPNTANSAAFAGSQLKDQKLKGSSAVKNEFVVYKMDLTFNESAGNTYQGGSFAVDINLVATQNKDSAEFPTPIGDVSEFMKNVNVLPDNSTVILSGNISFPNNDDGNIFSGNTVNLDFNGKTATCPDSNSNAVFRSIGSGTVANFSNGEIVAGKNAFCTIIVKEGATANLNNMKLSNQKSFGNNLKVLFDSKIVLRNCTVNSTLGGGTEAAGGIIDIYNSTFSQAEAYDWNSTNVAVSNGGTANIFSGTFVSENCGLCVFNSGGTINVYGGSFNANTVLKADGSTTVNESTINVYGGSFTGKIFIGNASKLNIEAGTFANTGLTAEQFQSYVAEGSTFAETNGVFTVTK